jgi:hypothetical protein
MLGTAIAIACCSTSGGLGSRREANHWETKRGVTIMNNRLFWAFLWVIGLPLPLVIILYMLFGHHG